MSKELTKKWKNGVLPDGYYYIDYDTQQKIFEVEDGCATYQGLPAETYFLNDVCLIKVLAPVPSYEELQKLKKQLEEANEALKEVCMHAETEQFECRCGWVEPCKDCNAHYSARNYLKKWGVK